MVEAVHAHSGRLYFKTQMRKAGVDSELRNYMMGHKLAYGGAYDKYSVAEVNEALTKARDYLMIAPESLSKLQRRKEEAVRAIQFVPDDDIREQMIKWIMAQESTEEINKFIRKQFMGIEKLEVIK